MFVGRERELAALESQYAREGFAFPVIYGRRRVGKTRLIQEFIHGKPTIYFMATEQDQQAQLTALSAAVKSQYPDPRTQYLPSFPSFEALFSYLTDIAKEKRIIFAIDEYPYLAKAVPEISSLLQKTIDQAWQGTQLYLILCGSSMSFMERQVLAYESPLYGRRTGQLKLHPLPYYESMRFFPAWQPEEKLMAYGVTGGIPQYLEFLSRYPSLTEAVVEEFLTTGGRLQDEPANLMLQELREPMVYNSILSAVARGASRQNEIAQAVGKTSSQITFYLQNLADLEIIRRLQPIESRSHRKSIYRITDNLYRFWYRFLPACASLTAMGLGKRALREYILPHFPEYFGHVFEDLAMQYLQRQMETGAIGELYTRYGSWWGTDPATHREEEIDLVCANDTDILCGECKWRKEPVDKDVFDTLLARTQLIAKGRTQHYALFSRTGFTEAVQRTAEPSGALLVTEEDMVELEK